ncbi:DNA adenine methylase [Limisalsivibrio acetivorans]|uniref:DNA adenine methylase n=1 Tax=Limisalsivibrio acetivorans TaxID=1304888 RepID=UPI0003B50638|nr:DNA adenine methylase [Limisalsivibrio acetivorans]
MQARTALERSENPVRPLLKWAGGKTRLIPQYKPYFPNRGVVYYEPFAGGGAVFLYLASRGLVKKAFLNDLNTELVNLYTVVRDEPEELIERACAMRDYYLGLDGAGRAEFYYDTRQAYNRECPASPAARAAMTVFLNKTCYNGLYRVNSKGEFNVPAGRYKSPSIVEPENVRLFSALLRETEAEIGNDDFDDSVANAARGDFVYYDPPYRPISRTSHFTSYSANSFDDAEQERLAATFRKLAGRGVRQMLSNSDPKNNDPDDNFFDDLYEGFTIKRVKASRMINSRADKRGSVSELLITV